MKYKRLNLCSTVTIGALAAVLAYAPLAEAAVIVTDPGDNRLRNNGTANYNGSLGYVFTINTADDIEVTHLGVWDGPGIAGSANSGTVGDGLVVSSKVVIYKVDSVTQSGAAYSYVNGGEVVSATVGAGTTGALLDEYRYVPLPEAVVLETGKTYQIVMASSSGHNAFLDYKSGNDIDAIVNNDFYVYPTVVHGSRTSDHPNFSVGGTNNGRQGGAYAGPNFQYIPEPASLALLGLGGLMMIGRRRR